MYTGIEKNILGRINTKPKMREPDINKIQEELELVKKKLRISEQDVFRLAAEKIDLQNTIKELNQNKDDDWCYYSSMPSPNAYNKNKNKNYE